MPVPQPRKGEHRDAFHSRCMGDTENAKAFPDEKQRNAICYRSWDDAHPENPHPPSKQQAAMPMPEPGESPQTFVRRCMADPEMQRMHPNRTERQQMCQMQYDEEAGHPMEGMHFLRIGAFTHSSTIAPNEPDWGSVDKTKLPRLAFADQGQADQKSTWRYPHHWVMNGGNEDANGVYTTGTMYLHVGGWQAAMNAAHGARSGQHASQAVINHLESHRSAIDTHRQAATALLPDTMRCWSNHMGLWCIEPFWFGCAVTAWKEGLWPRLQAMQALDIQAAERRPYDLTQEGTAIIPLMGPLTKGGSMKFDGTSTVRTRQALRMALRDEGVKNVLLHVDSPGGHVAGIEALAGDVASLRQHKPVIAHVDDLGASAAYWVASQADKIYANATSEVGSIGTIAVVEDTSGRMDRLGVKVHVIATGPYKGVGVEGAPITEQGLEYLKTRVAGINQHFLAAVERGRRVPVEQVQSWADGKVHLATEAHGLGLIDGVQPFEATLAQLASPGRTMDGRIRATRAAAKFAAWQARHI